jgi:DNA modification methylase
MEKNQLYYGDNLEVLRDYIKEESVDLIYLDPPFNSRAEYNVFANGLGNFWSLLKRGISGTYISVEPFHLFRYLDEQTFRYNHREGFKDGDRFDFAVWQIVGKRLRFDRLTGKNQPGGFLT